MNKDAEIEVRPRPLSTGLWTLFSWLRRNDRSVSSESLSSAGSDRSAASFAFLRPAYYHIVSDPHILPPPGPPTDSYKKRVNERNLRRQYDRDLTLHRKYGLFKNESGHSFDAFSLPPTRRVDVGNNKWDRERRATSECLQRRSVHVPGKRRAPAPPVPSASLPRRHSRKRPAPQPPGKFIEIDKENCKSIETVNTNLIQIDDMIDTTDEQKPKHNDLTMGCKSEKYSKKESAKGAKVRREKSFLKHIFDNKKRNSAIDISSVKMLPSISELDQQAAEIIKTSKIKPLDVGNSVENVLFRETSSDKIKNNKNAISKGSNSYTQTETDFSNNASTSKTCSVEEKQKLKEMLKEMKDSLSKRPKHDLNEMKPKNIVETGKPSYLSVETPTLRVGQSAAQVSASLSSMKTSTIEPVVTIHQQYPIFNDSVLVTQPVVIAHSAEPKLSNTKIESNNTNEIDPINNLPVINDQATHMLFKPCMKYKIKESSSILTDKKALHTPLKISSLLNPVYVPNETVSLKPSLNILQSSQSSSSNIVQPIYKIKKPKVEGLSPINLNSSIPSSLSLSSTLNITPSSSSPSQSNTKPIETKTTPCIKDVTPNKINTPIGNLKKIDTVSNAIIVDEKIQNKAQILTPSPSKENKIINENQNQHSKRRDLINQLEQSIAKGDERAAAEAAAKLAQLRLSCSVLSFSSQILSQKPTTACNLNTDKNYFKLSETTQVPTETGQVNQTKSKMSPRSVMLIEKSEHTNTVPSDVKPDSDFKIISAARTPPLKPEVKSKSQNGIEESRKEDGSCNIALHEATTSRRDPYNNQDNIILIAVLVEDREATRGPVHLRITRQANMRDLRREAEISLGLAANLQRWIIGRVLCTNDDTLVVSLAGPDFSAPFYLCLVESETKANTLGPDKIIDKKSKSVILEQHKGGNNVYTELVQLEQQAFVPNTENFECGVCMEEYAAGGGVVLRDCVHTFCKECLADVVRLCEEPNVSCPAMGCRGNLQEREIRAIVSPAEYERWLARGLAAAESGTRNAFHCRTKDCTGWALCDPGVRRFPCPVCKCVNCVPCQAIHDGETCQRYQAKLEETVNKSASQADEGTRTLLNSLINKGEALECPECKAIITKKWGCDWVKCSACKTEICWVTRGRRWGPGGRGDTSAGCRCGVDGKRCHPSCGYCH